MKESILFSAIGGHDPVASYHDGAMIHICRVYQPRKVYLYLSKEMVERSEVDHRYEKSLELLQKETEIHFDEIRMIKKPDLVDVQLFDSFYQEFDVILKEIHMENPNVEILVNISSGTPAMKNALNLIATLSPYLMRVIQVSTPNKRENPKEEHPMDYDLESYWACNEDCETPFVNRCEEMQGLNLLSKIKKETIRKMLDAYDYAAAFTIAEEIAEFLPEEALDLLRIAKSRCLLDQRTISKLMTKKKYDLFPIQDGNKREIFEYVLVLQIKQKRGDYADFIRGITPVILDLFEECLKAQCKIDIRDYCRKVEKDGQVVYYLSNVKFNSSEMGRNYKKIITRSLGQSELKEIAYSSAHIYSLLEELCEDKTLVGTLKDIREVEKNVRNVTAHEIVSVTEEWIEKRVSMNSGKILKLLKTTAVKSGFNIKNEYWDSYDQMNAVIKELLG